MPNKTNLILVGPMGAGKSAVGRHLALSLSKKFFDTDHTIVDRTGVDIAYIFEKEGEDGFRNRETQVIEELCQLDNIVLSTGGGSLVRKKNRKILKESGLVIYLHATVDQQANRTKKKENRPLLHTDNPRAVLENLMQQREKFYRQISDIVIHTDGQKVEKVVKKILGMIDEFNKPEKIESLQNDYVAVKTQSREYQIIFDTEKHTNIVDTPNVVITDENLDSLYRENLEKVLKPLAWLVIPASESSKSFEHYQWLINQLVELGITRDVQLIGIGGGVVGDLTGFVAATYMRGLKLVHVPTSLLAMVDSSIGGKTGINLAQGKNLVGSIYQPHQVLINIEFLKTLPQDEFIGGMAEVIKYGLIHKPEFLDYIRINSPQILCREKGYLEKIVYECAESKASIVMQDEQDFGQRMLLNLGHTFGHAIEKLQNYSGFSHGQAVAVGTCIAADVSHAIGHISNSDTQKVKDIFSLYGLPISVDGIKASDVLSVLQIDKKHTSTKKRFILLKSLGEAYIEDNLDDELLSSVIKKYFV